MKKAILLISLLHLCFIVSSCDPSTYRFDYSTLANNITRIELINYANPEQKHFAFWVPDYSSDLVPFRNSYVTVVETLDTNKTSAFLNQLSEKNILSHYYAYDSPNGFCIRLLYSDGDFLIISCNYAAKAFSGYIGKFSEDGEVSNFIGCFEDYDSFQSLVNDFFETKI